MHCGFIVPLLRNYPFYRKFAKILHTKTKELKNSKTHLSTPLLYGRGKGVGPFFMLNRITLDNGLRVVHQQDVTTQMVCVNTLYKIGSRNEDPNHTGFAHLFEHLMFGGTPRVPDFDLVLQDGCGENNAFTTEDITNYYITLPASNLELALFLEADRMRGLAFTPRSLQVQRRVVMEEFRMSCLNQPYGDASHLLYRWCFPKDHPYSWPTIGKQLNHIKNATMEQVKAFFRSYYRPDNAIVSVVGNVEWEEVLRLIKKVKFPNRRSGAVPELHLPIDADGLHIPGFMGGKIKTYYRDVPSDLLLMAFRIPSRSDDRFQACDMLSDVLANGRSSRLYARLVEQEKVVDEVDAYVDGRLGTGLLFLELVLADGADIRKVEEMVWQELQSLCREPLSDKELQKVKNKYETNTHILLSDYQQRAEQLAYFEMLGDANRLYDDLPRYLAVTSSELQQVAKQVLTREGSTTIRYMAK